jgi:hypothetical protein
MHVCSWCGKENVEVVYSIKRWRDFSFKLFSISFRYKKYEQNVCFECMPRIVSLYVDKKHKVDIHLKVD